MERTGRLTSALPVSAQPSRQIVHVDKATRSAGTTVDLHQIAYCQTSSRLTRKVVFANESSGLTKDSRFTRPRTIYQGGPLLNRHDNQ